MQQGGLSLLTSTVQASMSKTDILEETTGTCISWGGGGCNTRRRDSERIVIEVETGK